MVVVLGLEQLARGKVGEPSKTIGEATNAVCEFDQGETHSQHTSRWLGKSLFNKYAEVDV